MKKIIQNLLLIITCLLPVSVNAGVTHPINPDAVSASARKITPDTWRQIDTNGRLGFSTVSVKSADLVSGSCSPAAEETELSGNYFLDAFSAAIRLILGLDSELFLVVSTSLKISLIAVFLASLVSVPLGLVVALSRFRGKQFLLSLLNTCMALPTVVVGLLLYGLLNRQGLFGDFGLLYTPAAMVIGQWMLITPIIWNLSIAAASSADPRLHTTCLSLGANLLQQGLIYTSEVRYALIAAIVAGFGRAIGEVGVAMMLGGNIHGFTRTMTTAIALETSKGEFEFALALGFMLLLVAFVVNTALQRFQRAK